ncbi:DUF2264 domain-containing protein [Persicitalea jodogahamensis]|uniref:DUF2264 domain-containing protein n=1 Tax=Persicitalea jodogahamensis TaxID=402147 RepID=A0A8J3GAD9_9BACT|nr:DUF2264 domain-containing protein [Persicitalea jodogahamensis]GHB79916.1 hypothetical protein GCM10007390_37630 [Persicitalea jodogahamensis]
MIRRLFIKSLGLTSVASFGSFQPPAPSDRQIWLSHLDKLAKPVLENLANDTLKANMPVEGKTKDRPEYTHLEAFGRLMAGISPWLNQTEFSDPAEKKMRDKYFALSLKALDNASNPNARDFMNYNKGGQPVVDASFLADGLIRAPKLWEAVPGSVKENVVKAFLSSRVIRPGFNNWLLFSAMIETFFAKYGYEYDRMRIDYALRQHEQWYKGDGIYGDGPNFHWDYYNSYVIQPYLYDILEAIVPKEKVYEKMAEDVTKRAIRYAAIQERLISPEGTFPIIGRSIAYRAGAFQHLANMALVRKLPKEVAPAQVRSALTAVIQRTTESPETYDAHGWLQIGVHGHQPAIGETYISTGSLYLCATALLPLGLPASDPFWSAPAADWTNKKVWGSVDIPTDHALY